nr:Uma2 family endonuclease [Streptomyces sp. SID5468]
MALGEDRGQRRELIGEALMLSPRPGVGHQRALSRLAQSLDSAVQAAGAPFEVMEAVNLILPDGLFIPDIVVVGAEAADKDPVTFDAESALLVVEIVSPSSNGRRVDRLLKPPYYAEAGIEHLWRLELEPSPTLIAAELEDGRYVNRVVAEDGAVTRIGTPFPVEIDPGTLVRQKR